MINETFLPLEAERITNNLKKDILEYLPEIFISEKTASTNDDAKVYLPNQSSELSIHLTCLLYTSPSPRDLSTSRMPSSA